MVKILDGRKVRDQIKQSLAQKISKLRLKPTLVIIQVGDLVESNAYIKQKTKFGEDIGVQVGLLKYPVTVSTKELISDIENLNRDTGVQGIIIQLPLPTKLDKQEIVRTINPSKDVDGLINPEITPATARGIISLLDFYKIKLAGQHVVVVGRSDLVGKPTARALLARNATVTTAHSWTKNLPAITKSADILIVATGKPKLIKPKHVCSGQVIIDVGITPMKNKLVGDVDFKNVAPLVRAISPVPGGVGPLTVASLFQNLIENV